MSMHSRLYRIGLTLARSGVDDIDAYKLRNMSVRGGYHATPILRDSRRTAFHGGGKPRLAIALAGGMT
jgi:hypothetical protein